MYIYMSMFVIVIYSLESFLKVTVYNFRNDTINGKIQNLQMSPKIFFCASFYSFKNITILNY